jgi:undecaprenyl diphosphate synthase
MFSKHLYTRYYPDPDLLIRTSGEMRLSNFLLWQTSYTEMYVTPKLWPDFKKKIYSPQLKNSAAASDVTERWSSQ